MPRAYNITNIVFFMKLPRGRREKEKKKRKKLPANVRRENTAYGNDPSAGRRRSPDGDDDGGGGCRATLLRTVLYTFDTTRPTFTGSYCLHRLKP